MGYGKVHEPGCAVEAAYRFNCTESCCLSLCLLDLNHLTPLTDPRQQSTSCAELYLIQITHTPNKNRVLMCFSVLLTTEPEAIQICFHSRMKLRIWEQSAEAFSKKTFISLCLCNLTFCCFCHLHLVNAGQVFSSAGFSICRMSEGHTQDSGILGSCKGLAASEAA